MFTHLFLQIALASAGAFSSPASNAAKPDITITVPVQSEVPRVVAGEKDQNALDILNNTRRDILNRGVVLGCPVVNKLYVDGILRRAPEPSAGFSTATVYVAGERVMVMLPPSVADALRTVAATKVHDIQYVDCTAPDSLKEARNTLYITTK
jgi:hypothetical protein